MVLLIRGLLATLLLCALGCNGATPRPPAHPEPQGATRTALYLDDAIRVHKGVTEALQGLGEKIEEDRADGGLLRSDSPERPDRTWVRTRVWISTQREGGTRVTVKRSVVKRVGAHEIEWTSLPTLPEAAEEVLAALDRRIERATEPRRQ